MLETHKPFTRWLCSTLCIVVSSFVSNVQAQQWSSKGPVARSLFGAVWDSSTGRAIIYGGGTYGNCAVHPNDVWWLNSATTTSGGLSWVKAHPTGTSPAARIANTSVYDSSSNRMIVFGGGLGCSSPCASDTWILDHANGSGGTPTWMELNPSGTLPPPRLFHSAVYDPASNSMIVFGGADCFHTDFNDVWVLSNANGLGATSIWTELSPSGSAPSPRAYASAVYDPTNNIMVITSGEDESGSYVGDVWTLSHANGAGGVPVWAQLAPSGALPPRIQQTAVYDTTHNRMTIFGGQGTTGALSDVWVLAYANGIGGQPAWNQLATTASFPPQPRAGHGAIYNPDSNVMTIIGGSLGGGGLTNDVFFLTRANGL